MTRPEITGIAPFFIVRHVPTALAFYRDRLGFEIAFQGPEPDDIFFGIVKRVAATIILEAIGVEPTPNYTRDVKKGWARWDAYPTSPIRTRWPRNSRRATSSSFDHSGGDVPKDDDDGLRGFEVQDADGYVLLFGRPRS